jgi:predicted DNA-binding protein (MmcQ/YjbR family)
MARPARKPAVSGPSVESRVRAICLSYPETTETNSWGHPNFRAGKKTFITLEQKDSRPCIAFRLLQDQVQELCKEKGFFPTPYGKGLWVSLYADGRLNWRSIQNRIDQSYRLVAIKRMLDVLDSKDCTICSKYGYKGV